LTRKSTILNSPHKELIDDLLNKGHRVSEVLEILKEKGIYVSRSALYRYSNSYFSYKKKMVNELYEILYITGNSNLIRSLQKTIKVYRSHKKCLCNNPLPQDLHRKGRIYIHSLCNGWVPYAIAVYIKNRNKRGKPVRKYYPVIATARSY